MAASEILAVGTTAANSADVPLAAGAELSVCLKDAAGPTIGPRALVHILRKDDAGQYFRIAQLSTSAPGIVIQGEGTYRFSRVAGTSCGVFSG